MGTFDYLKRRPLDKDDAERICRLIEPLNADRRFLVQRCVEPDGSLRMVRVIDIRDRRTDEEHRHAEETRVAARLLQEAGFDAWETPASRSAWADLEIHERS